MIFPGPDQQHLTSVAAFTQTVLDRLRFGVQGQLGPSLVDSMQLDVTSVSTLYGQEGRQLVARLTAEVLGQNLGEHPQQVVVPVEWHCPATWRDHWKATVGTRWRLGRWWNRRRPPKLMTVSRSVTVNVKWQVHAGFPYASIVTDPRLGAPVLLVRPNGRPGRGEPSTATYRT